MPRFTITAFILLLITNVIVLAGVAYNRSGTPITSIDLTERELPIQYLYRFSDENSGVALDFKWYVLDPDQDPKFFFRANITPAWLDDAKLDELGFNIDALEKEKYKTASRIFDQRREVTLVLEYDGMTYQKALEIAETQGQCRLSTFKCLTLAFFINA